MQARQGEAFVVIFFSYPFSTAAVSCMRLPRTRTNLSQAKKLIRACFWKLIKTVLSIPPPFLFALFLRLSPCCCLSSCDHFIILLPFFNHAFTILPFLFLPLSTPPLSLLLFIFFLFSLTPFSFHPFPIFLNRLLFPLTLVFSNSFRSLCSFLPSLLSSRPLISTAGWAEVSPGWRTSTPPTRPTMTCNRASFWLRRSSKSLIR